MRPLGFAVVSLIVPMMQHVPHSHQNGCGVQITYSTYAVHGSSLAEIRASMKQHGPVDELGVRRHAITKWKVTWKWDRDLDGNVRADSVSIQCSASIVLPQLENEGSLSPEEQQAWSSYSARLKAHELNHVKHIDSLAPEILDRIRVRAHRSGKIKAPVAQRIASGVLQEARELDRSYDHSTKHGKTEGL